MNACSRQSNRGERDQGGRGGGRDRNKKDKDGEPSFKKISLYQLGLRISAKSAEKKTVFDDDENLTDQEAKGEFKHPEDAYRVAKRDLRSEQWQTEVDGLAALVRLVEYHPDLILDDLKFVVAAVLHECRNLRSQVTRAAIQAFTLMFEHLGMEMEIKGLEDVAEMLFTKV